MEDLQKTVTEVVLLGPVVRSPASPAAPSWWSALLAVQMQTRGCCPHLWGFYGIPDKYRAVDEKILLMSKRKKSELLGKAPACNQCQSHSRRIAGECKRWRKIFIFWNKIQKEQLMEDVGQEFQLRDTLHHWEHPLPALTSSSQGTIHPLWK